ncbi:ribosomal protein L24, bacterial/organelle [Moorena producens 3L]|uniref:Large ribosomal subunit protein uL24 n=1 Tax=Moorena producens 3L TaxID=489825 RepID=F4Y3A0_9CYAN|nr:ribosomal protein L24, bacterial/organelle [Moorena producens 3L]
MPIKHQKAQTDTPLRYKMHVKKGDTVQVIAGRDKGKIGEILRTLPKISKVVVKGVNVKTKHVKPQQEGEKGQIATFEAPIHSSNVMLYSNKEKLLAASAIPLPTMVGRCGCSKKLVRLLTNYSVTNG